MLTEIILFTKRSVLQDFYSSFISNSKKMSTMHKGIVVYSCNRILFINKKKLTTNTCKKSMNLIDIMLGKELNRKVCIVYDSYVASQQIKYIVKNDT